MALLCDGIGIGTMDSWTATGEFTISASGIYRHFTQAVMGTIGDFNDSIQCRPNGVMRFNLNGTTTEAAPAVLLDGDPFTLTAVRDAGGVITFTVNGTVAPTITNANAMVVTNICTNHLDAETARFAGEFTALHFDNNAGDVRTYDFTNSTGTTLLDTEDGSKNIILSGFGVGFGLTEPLPAPTITISKDPATSFVDQLITFTANTTNTTSIAWSATAGITLDANTGNVITATPTADGTYTITAVATGNGGDTTATLEVTVVVGTPAPTITISKSPSTSVVSQLITFTASTTDTDSIAWSATGGLVLDANTGNSITATPSSIGTYTLTAIATGAGGDTTATLEVTVVAETPTPTPTPTPTEGLTAHVTFTGIASSPDLTNLTGIISDANSKEVLKTVTGISITGGSTNKINLEGTNINNAQPLELMVVRNTGSVEANVDYVINAFAPAIVTAPQKKFLSWIQQNRRIEYGPVQFAIGDTVTIKYAIGSRESTKAGTDHVIIGHTNVNTPARIQIADVMTDAPKLQMTDDVTTEEIDISTVFEHGQMTEFKFSVASGNVHTFFINGVNVGTMTFPPILTNCFVNVNQQHNCFFEFFEIERGGTVVYQSDTSYIPPTKFSNINNNVDTLNVLQNYVRGDSEFNIPMTRSGDYWVHDSSLNYFKILDESVPVSPKPAPDGVYTLVISTGQSLGMGFSLGDEYEWCQASRVSNCWVERGGSLEPLKPEQYVAAYSMIEEYAAQTDRNFVFIQAAIDGTPLDGLTIGTNWNALVNDIATMGVAMGARTIGEVIIPHIHLESDAINSNQATYPADVNAYFDAIFSEVDTELNSGYLKRIIVSPMGFSIGDQGTDAMIKLRFNLNNMAQTLHDPANGRYVGAPRGHLHIYPAQAHTDAVHYSPIGYDKLGREFAQVIDDLEGGGSTPFRMSSASFVGNTVTISFENLTPPIMASIGSFAQSLGFMFKRTDDTYYLPSSAVINPADNTVTLVSGEALSTNIEVCYYDYLTSPEGAPLAPIMDSTGYQCLKTSDVINKRLCPTSIALVAG